MLIGGASSRNRQRSPQRRSWSNTRIVVRTRRSSCDAGLVDYCCGVGDGAGHGCAEDPPEAERGVVGSFALLHKGEGLVLYLRYSIFMCNSNLSVVTFDSSGVVVMQDE